MRGFVPFAAVLGVALAAAAPASGALKLELDYSYDTTAGFFNDPARREMMDLAVDSVNRYLDTLSPIVPSGDNTWTAKFSRPDTGARVFLINPTIQSDTVVVYVGGAPMNNGSVLAETGMGTYSASGPQTWLDSLKYRGKPPDADNTYAPWGGSISFNATKDWYFGKDPAGIGGDQFDFLSTAMHELGHVLGIGPASSWKSRVDAVEGGYRFTGTAALAAGSPNNPQLLLADQGHWAEGTLSTVAGVTQVAALDPYLSLGEHKRLTDLDFAAFTDIGWHAAAAGDVNRDGRVDSSDIDEILAANSYDNGPGWGWSTGDNDGDGRVDSSDIDNILAAGLYDAGPYAAGVTPGGEPWLTVNVNNTVLDAVGLTTRAPEPGTLVVLGLGGVAALLRRRRRRAT